MALFQYFPNYVWNLSVAVAMESGGRIGEIVDMCQPLLDKAQQAYDRLVNSPRRELKIFTPREGGVEHVGADNMAFGRDYIADWLAETLVGRTA